MERQVSREIRDKSVGFTLEQACLNIEARTRTSRLPWRGQFSPELIEHLIDRVCPDSRRFLDPFCGSGTVLYEALHKGRVAIGAEVNPAAWHLAALASFVTLPTIERQFALAKVRKIASDLGFVGSPGIGSTDCAGQLLQLVKCEAHPFIRKALAAVVLLGMGDLDELSTEAIARGGFAVNTLLNGLK